MGGEQLKRTILEKQGPSQTREGPSIIIAGSRESEAVPMLEQIRKLLDRWLAPPKLAPAPVPLGRSPRRVR